MESGTTNGLELRRRDLEPFDGAEHGDGRGDDAVAEEQRRAEQAEHHRDRGRASC